MPEAKIPIRKVESTARIETAQPLAESVYEKQAPAIDQESGQKTEKQDLLKPRASTTEAILHEKDPRIKFLEDVLSDGLQEYWSSLSQGTQNTFKIKGENVAIEIDHLLSQDSTEAEEIYEKIFGWLKISGWDENFISQEAKLKTDKLLKHARRPISQ